jgi:DNA-binding XRE family transcriptional regulator
MGQRPRTLIPDASPLHRFGAALRTLRLCRRLSQAALGARVLASAETIAKVEKAQRWPTADLATRCETELDACGDLLRLWPEVEQYRHCLLRAGRSLRLPVGSED